MKLNLIPILIATASVTYAAPEGLHSGFPAFLDIDGDGIISEVERQAFVESCKTAPRGGASDWDTNGDGIELPLKPSLLVSVQHLQSHLQRFRAVAKIEKKIPHHNIVLATAPQLDFRIAGIQFRFTADEIRTHDTIPLFRITFYAG